MAAFGLLSASALALGCQRETTTETASANIPQGDGYDFFVLSLSWSPSYCETEGENANRQQCASANKHGFVVHGLWPQFERGWPEYCDSTEPKRVRDVLVREYLDIIPSAGLIGHQWRKHGSCAGMNQVDYFAVARAAHGRVRIPARFDGSTSRLAIAPDDVEAAFLGANSGLSADGIAVTCRGPYVAEVRICMTKALDFRSCEEVDARACRIPDAVMPAPGG